MSNTNDHQEESLDLDPTRVVLFIDNDSAPLPVEVMFEVEQDGVTYALLTPAEPVVLILKQDLLDQDTPLESLDVSDFDAVKQNIQNALIKYGAKIEVKGDEFVLVGELDERIYGDCDMMELEEDGDVHEYLIIVTVDDATHHHFVALAIEPPIYAGKIVGEEAHPLNDQELSGVEELLSQELLRLAEEAQEVD